MAEKKTRIPRPNAQIISDAQIRAVIALMADEGLHFTGACEKIGLGMHRQAIRNRILADDELRDADARARSEYLVKKVAEMTDIVRKKRDPARARLLCDNIKWEAARVCRKLYGDQQRVEHTGEDGGPIVGQITVRFVAPVAPQIEAPQRPIRREIEDK